MPRDGALTLSDVHGATLAIVCQPCAMRGRYDSAPASATICPSCGGRMRVIETFVRGAEPRSFKAEPAGIDSS